MFYKQLKTLTFKCFKQCFGVSTKRHRAGGWVDRSLRDTDGGEGGPPAPARDPPARLHAPVSLLNFLHGYNANDFFNVTGLEATSHSMSGGSVFQQ